MIRMNGMGMGPRGPMHGHRGFNRGFGLGVLGLLPALLFGGWIVLAVFGAVIGALVMAAVSVFGGLACAAESVLSGISSPAAVAAGAVIGYMMVRRLRNRKAEKAAEAETAVNEEHVMEYSTMNSLNNRNG